MSPRRRCALLVVAVVVAAFPAIPPGPVAATSTAQVDCGGQLQVPDGVTNPAQPLGTVPIVLVHGITDSGALWSKPALDGGPTLAQQLGALPAASVWAFDYHAASIEWVTHPRIGPALADAITCLSRATGNKVVLIAHSMGGLAIEYAAGQDDVAGQIAQIATIATPFDGSASLTAVAAVLQQTAGSIVREQPTTLAKVLLSFCTRLNREAYVANDGVGCGFAGIPGSPVGAALQVGSDEIAALPPWPADVPTFRVAGDMSLYPFGRGIFGAALDALGRPPLRVGDIAVAVESALSPRVQGPTLVVPCDATVAEMMDARCFHSNLPMDREVIDAVYAQVEPVVTNQSEPGGGGADATADLYTRTYEFDCFEYPPTQYEETPRSAPSGPGPTQRYPLVDGLFFGQGDDPAVSINMVKLDVADFDGDGATEATVLLNCENVTDFVRDHDYLFAFEAGPDGWAQIGDPLAAWYVVNVGNGLYESYDRSTTTYEDNTYKRTVWKVDPGDPRVFVPVEHGPKVPLEQLPQDPGRFVTSCPCFPPGS